MFIYQYLGWGCFDMENMFEYDDSNKLSFNFEGFTGPLDLLLDMIKEKNMSVMTVPMSSLTDQYLRHIETMNKYDMEDVTSFLVLASRILEMKSRELLPKDEVVESVEEDGVLTEEKLRMMLAEYEIFKDAGNELHKVENIDRLYKQPDKNVGDARIVFNQFNLDKMLDAFAFILMKTKDKEHPQEKKISRDRWTVADKVAFLNSVLTENEQINFFSLFDDTYSKLEVITVFMAILELLKMQKIEVLQAEKYSDITIRRKENTNET